MFSLILDPRILSLQLPVFGGNRGAFLEGLLLGRQRLQPGSGLTASEVACDKRKGGGKSQYRQHQPAVAPAFPLLRFVS
jgi:hypothetical protein